jgi:hypothetical protein
VLAADQLDPDVVDAEYRAGRRGGDRTRRLFTSAVLNEVHLRNGHVVEEANKEPLDLPFAVPKFEYDDVVEVMGLCSNPSWPADLGKCGPES